MQEYIPPNSQIAATLLQANTGRTLPPSGWACDDCQAATNLWLNLADGHIGCGRPNPFFEGQGQGHAITHYNLTGNSLVVKLGTITPDGKADVYCYLEDGFVTNPFLEQHLKHWGLDMKTLTKSDKTGDELSIELQGTFDWSSVTD